VSSLSYSAAQAWVRARLSRLLDRDTWLRLLDCRDSADIVGLLRTTWAAPAVADDGRILPRKLRGDVASAAETLGRFLPLRAKRLLAWHNRRFEIENLKVVLRAIHNQVDRRRAAGLLIPLRASRGRWEALLDSGSVGVVVDRLRDSVYARPLEHALERYEQERRLLYLEVALDLFYFQRLVRLIATQRGTDGADARAWLGREIAVQNLLWACRFRIYAGMRPEEILNYTLHRAFAMGLDAVRRVALGATVEEEVRRLGLIIPPGLSEIEALGALELLAERERYQRAAAALGRPLFRLGGPLAYLSLLECEVRDLSVLAEGKAAGLTRAEIARRLLRAA
jgi:V/A-type H+/Na+-transporting ATPase subunit C